MYDSFTKHFAEEPSKESIDLESKMTLQKQRRKDMDALLSGAKTRDSVYCPVHKPVLELFMLLIPLLALDVPVHNNALQNQI